MKSVKSVAELQHLALAHGASVSLGSSRFNTTGDRVSGPAPARAVAHIPEPVAPPPPAQPQVIHVQPHIHVDLGEAVSGALSKHAEDLHQMVSKAVASIPQSAPAAGKPKGWRMTVVRDKDGLLHHVDLHPHPTKEPTA
jgi:hypothetical protein